MTLGRKKMEEKKDLDLVSILGLDEIYRTEKKSITNGINTAFELFARQKRTELSLGEFEQFIGKGISDEVIDILNEKGYAGRIKFATEVVKLYNPKGLDIVKVYYNK